MNSLGGDLLAMIWQIAAAVGVPLVAASLLGTTIDERYGTAPWGLLVSILLGLGLAGGGMFVILRRYLRENPVGPASEAAREAARRWRLEEDQKEREGGEGR